jgi:aspartyl protease
MGIDISGGRTTWTSRTHFIVAILAVLILSAPIETDAQARNNNSSRRTDRLQSGPNVRFDSGDRALGIPLEIDNKIILMRVRVNDSQPLKFIFDTGAFASVLSAKQAARLRLKSYGQASADATGGPVATSFIKGVSLRVPGAQISNQIIAVMDIPNPPGFEFDGIIGYDFINQFVVEIDYQKKVMNLYSPRTYHYSGHGEVIPLSLAGRKIPLVITKIILEGRAPIEANVALDTGADLTILINSPTVKKYDLRSIVLQGVQKRRGAGGEEQRILGRVKAIQLGHFNFENPPIVLSLDTEGAGAREDNDGVVGGELLRRFKVIVDYSRRRMILERNKSFNEPYDIEGDN